MIQEVRGWLTLVVAAACQSAPVNAPTPVPATASPATARVPTSVDAGASAGGPAAPTPTSSAGAGVARSSRVTVSHRHGIARELEPSAPVGPSNGQLFPAFAGARALASEVKREVERGHWTFVIRTGCPTLADGRVIVEARGAVLDGEGQVRFFSELAGTDDSAGSSRFWYDEDGRLTVVAGSQNHYNGSGTTYAVLLDGSGSVTACWSAPSRRGLLLDPCERASVSERDAVDPEVAGMLRSPSNRTWNDFLRRSVQGWVKRVPREEFEACTVGYEAGG